MPNKLLGQNFLSNHLVIGKIIAAIDVHSGDEIIEIGSGHGELTLPLSKICGEVGAKLIAVEKDKKLAMQLRVTSGEWRGKPEIIQGDIFDFLATRNSQLATFKIVGNLPYYLTGRLLRVIGETENRPEQCVFMVQDEVAERMIAEPPNMNRLAASVQYWAKPKIITRVSRKDFAPQPNVDSAVIILEKLPVPMFPDSNQYFAAMRILFAQPRKTVLNNLEAGHLKKTKVELVAELEKMGIKLQNRPQNLTVGDVARIAQNFPLLKDE